MKSRFEQGVLKRLAAVAIAFGAGIAPAESLEAIPTGLLDDIVDGIEDLNWRRQDRRRLLGLLSYDARAEVRRRVAAKAAAVWPDAPHEIELVLRRLARDPSPAVRAAAAASIEEVLCSAPPFARIQIVADWSTSEVREERAAIAAALRGSTPVFIGDLAIEYLAQDPDPVIRRLAMQAAAHRFDENPTAYTQVAVGATSDPVRQVRRNARRLLDRALRC